MVILTALIVGSGDGWFDEYERVKRAVPLSHTFGLNKVVKTIKTDHWVSLHPDQMIESGHGLKHSNLPDSSRIDVVWQYNNRGGTSALFALDIVRRLLYNRVFICGVPLSHKYKDGLPKWDNYKAKYGEWCGRCVRSFSGETLKLFGNAEEWI